MAKMRRSRLTCFGLSLFVCLLTGVFPVLKMWMQEGSTTVKTQTEFRVLQEAAGKNRLIRSEVVVAAASEKEEDISWSTGYDDAYVLTATDPGEGGYYCAKPEICIRHKKEGYRTYYVFQDANGNRLEGCLMNPGEIYQVKENEISEGKNTMKIWVEKLEKEPVEKPAEPENPKDPEEPEDTKDSETSETPDGAEEVTKPETPEDEESLANPEGSEEVTNPKMPEESEGPEEDPQDSEDPKENETEPVWKKADGSEREQVFLVDTIRPVISDIQYPVQTGSRPYCYSGEAVLRLTAEDTGSGVKEICYMLPGRDEQRVNGNYAEMKLPDDFQGKIRVYCVDEAGNIGSTVTTPELLCDSRKPEISITAPDGFQIWYQKQPSLSLAILDHELSSGLAAVECHVNGKPVLRESWSYEQNQTGYVAKIPIEEWSRNGGKIPVTVEVWDQAGNLAIESCALYTDGTAPEIHISGIEAGQITSQPVALQIDVNDDNRLQTATAELEHRDADENVVKENLTEWSQKGESSRLIRKLEEDGYYRLKINAADQAGNKSQKELSFIIDRTNPVIRYVDQMQGSHVQYFQWNYRQEELIKDFTEYTYQIRLNNAPYLPGTKVRTEGNTVLTVEAKDAAGNAAKAEAEFVIDHTEPVILFGDVISGHSYENEVLLTVSTKDAEERITSITINGEKQKLSSNSSAFRFPIQLTGTYHVEVTARDLAKNEACSSIDFKIVERKNLLQKLTEPVQGTLEQKRDSKTQRVEKENKSGGGTGKQGFVLSGVLLCIGIAVFLFWKRKRRE